MDDRPTVAEVVDKLKTLGSADQIATFLEGEEVQGQCGSWNFCPIATYVKRETGCLQVLVGHGAVVAHDNGRRESVPWGAEPDSIGAFIRRFDGGAYPSLEKKFDV